VKPQIDVTHTEDGKNEEDAHHDHQDVRLSRFGQIERQMMGRHRMQLIGQMIVSRYGR
jgi:hypothetical protein